MHLPTGDLAWEGAYQIVMAIVFFGFVLFAYNNGMNNTDIAMWLSLAGTSGAVTWVKSVAVRNPPSDDGGE